MPIVHGALEPSAHDHDLIAHALNERFVELGGNHPVAYVRDDGPGKDKCRLHRWRRLLAGSTFRCGSGVPGVR